MKNNKGFGLVETLIASAIGLTLVLALAKTSTGQYNFYKAIQSVFDEQDLSYSLGKVLTDDISCKANLKPSRLNNGDMTTLVQGLNDPNVEDMPLVTVNTNFKSLSIVKMSLSGSGDPKTQAVSRELTVYFKRKGIKNKDNNPCDSSDTSGCYTTNCFLKYQVENNPSPDVTLCDVQTCAGRGGSNLSGIKCNDGYLVGFDKTGQKICRNLSDLWSCPAGQDIRGFDSSGTAICGVSELCGDNEVLKGFNPDGTQNCVVLASSPPPSPPPSPPSSPSPPPSPPAIDRPSCDVTQASHCNRHCYTNVLKCEVNKVLNVKKELNFYGSTGVSGRRVTTRVSSGAHVSSHVVSRDIPNCFRCSCSRCRTWKSHVCLTISEVKAELRSRGLDPGRYAPNGNGIGLLCERPR